MSTSTPCFRCGLVRCTAPAIVCTSCFRRPLRALSLWQPWAEAIARLGKEVENRPRPPPASLVGDLLAIQASLKVDAVREARDAAALRAQTGRPLDPATLPRGALVALVRVVGLYAPDRSPPSPWWMGPQTWDGKPNRAWALEGARALPTPIPQKGHQGVWALPLDVSDALWQALAAGGSQGTNPDART